MSRRAPTLDEFSLIHRIARVACGVGTLPREVAVGIGDDAAVVRAGGPGAWVFTTDLLAEHVHFTRTTTPFLDLGYKSGAANLSDLAAMGAAPRYLLVDLALPPNLSRAQVLAFHRGLSTVCRPFDVHLIGGDTSASRSDLFIAVTAIGRMGAAPAIQRSGALVGDLVYVSGTLGDSLAGLALLQETDRRTNALSTGARRFLLARHRRPTPRVALGLALARRRLATAMLDVSDGLSGDLPHLCARSQVGVELEAAQIPTSTALRRFGELTGRAPLDLALQGGEDYELLFTASPTKRAAIAALGRRLGLPLTAIGRIVPESQGRRLRLADGRSRTLTVTGYRHFQSSSGRPQAGRR